MYLQIYIYIYVYIHVYIFFVECIYIISVSVVQEDRAAVVSNGSKIVKFGFAMKNCKKKVLSDFF